MMQRNKIPLAANLTTPAPTPDAELLELCDQLIELELEEKDLFDVYEDDDDRYEQLDALSAKKSPIMERLRNRDRIPATLAGARAMSRLAMLMFPDGEDFPDFEWCTCAAAQFLAGEGVA